MSIQGRFAGVVALLVLTAVPTSAQEPAKTVVPTPEAKTVTAPASRVPDYFGQIGLTPAQREDVLKLRAKHQKRIEDLQKEVVKARSEMMTECEGVLTDTQKSLLANLRKAAAEKQAARKAAAAKAKSDAEAPKTAERVSK